MEIPPVNESDLYIPLQEVTGSDECTKMLSVETQDASLPKEDRFYENKPEIDENTQPESKQPNINYFPGSTISETELRKQFNHLNYISEKSKRKTSTTSKAPENKPKNPIEIVLPYDSNRVVLLSEFDKNNYINASYINNYQFIATTHPMKNTLTDFLTMILQTEAKLVVLLSTEHELSEIDYFISKRVAYWGVSNSINNYPPFVVKTCDVSKQINLTIQTITLENENENREHTFGHIISTSWNDKGEELSLEGIVQLVKLIITHKRKNQGKPIIIHCRDGIGKTGVLLTVLRAIETMDTECKVDVCGIVQQLRNEREYAVPTLVSSFQSNFK